jgi:glutathione synthase/RimK-type ligase-like ATP-grasp enzyme
MANVRIIGKRGSKSRKDISAHTAVKLYTGQRNIDAIVNYGLVGQKLNDFFRKYPSAKNVPMINRSVGHSKYSTIKRAEDNDIDAPESLLSLPKTAKLSEWIEKKFNSSQGKGIIKARGRGRLDTKYYQKMVKDRKFELRVHSFLWIPTEEWTLHKRLGPADQIAWNFHQGGHFQNVMYPNKYQVFLTAKEYSTKILKVLEMSFGAVDFIVDNNNRVYFIEVNSSPGFTPFSEDVYYNAMNRLTGLSSRGIARYGR